MSAVIEVNPAQRAIEVLRAPNVVVVEPTQLAVEVNPPQAAIEVSPVVREVSIGAPGLRGERGEQGVPGETDGATFNAIAGATIHGQRAVRVAGGELFHPDTATTEHADQVIGIAAQSGLAGATISVRAKGVMAEPGWSWAPGAVYCGDDGVLTQSPSPAGWLLVVGRAITPTSIDVDIETAFHRS